MTTPINRHPERARTEVEELHRLLDDVMDGTLVTVTDDGRPWVVPMLFARDGDRLLFHGSTGAGALRHVAAGAPVAFSVTTIDALVVAHCTFEHSANYRSVVIHGSMTRLEGEEKWTALDTVSDRLLPGRVAEVREMTKRELAATMVLALPLTDWTMKARAGGPGATEEVHEAWTGVVPMRTVYGPAIPDPGSADRAVPASVRRLIDTD